MAHTLLKQGIIFWSTGKKPIILALLTLITTIRFGRSYGLSPLFQGIKLFYGGLSKEPSLLEESWANEVSPALLFAPDVYNTRKLLITPSCIATMPI
jgi:hypothetical protein